MQAKRVIWPDLPAFRFLALILITLALVATATPASAQRTPFGTPAPATEAPAAPQAVTEPSAFGKFWVWVQTTQRDLHRQLAGAVRKLKAGEGFAAVWLLASLSFIYGVVHAAGPGHGKAVISSYVLANEKTVRRGIALCFIASAVQALTAILLVGILAIALNSAGGQIKDSARFLETASYALVMLVGAWLLWSQVRRIWFASGGHAHDHAHGHDQHHHDHHHHDHGNDHHHHGSEHGHAHDGACCGHAHMPDAQQIAQASDWKSAAAIVLAVGIRPCTGAILILVFAFANGLFLAGVGATFAMALGTAITVSVLAVLAVTSREVAMRLAGPGSRWADGVMNAAALGGALLILGLGILLFAGSLGPARPF